MRALRILLIVVVIIGGLFVAADRVAVYLAEDRAADEVRNTQGLAERPDVSINGFPFLTQIAAGELDDVEIKIGDYEASTSGVAGGGARKGTDTMHLEDLVARMHGVRFSDDYSSATADTATGSARISYAELLKAAQVEPMSVAPGVTANVIKLSDGGHGKVKVTVQAKVLNKALPNPVVVMSTMHVAGDVVTVHADTLPSFPGVPTPENRVRQITDIRQAINGLPQGLHIDQVESAADGVHITVAGSHVTLAG